MAEKGSPPPPYTAETGTVEQPAATTVPGGVPPQYGFQPTYPTQPSAYPTQPPTYPAQQQPQYHKPDYPQGNTYPIPATTATVISVVNVGAGHAFGEHSVNMQCPYCREQVISRTEYVNGSLAWIICASLAFAGIFLLIPWFFCCVPFCLTACQDVEHYCPRCSRMLGVYRRIN